MKRLLLFSIVGFTLFASCKEDDVEVLSLPNSISIAEGETINMLVGKSMELHLSCTPDDAWAPKRTWSASGAVSVSENTGVVTANEEGEGIVTVTLTSDNTKTASCKIIVSAIAITDITVSPNDTIFIGEVLQLKPKVTPDTASYKNSLVYSSSDEKVAVVGQNGKVEAVGVGKCTIKAASPDGTVSAECALVVKPIDVTYIGFDKSDILSWSIELGETRKFGILLEPADATYKKVTWNVSDGAIASVAADGTLKGLGIGECTVTAVSSDPNIKANCTVKVTPVEVKNIELNKKSLKIYKDATDTLKVNVISALGNIIPAVDAHKNVTWTSSDEKIATVDDKGVVKGIAKGSAKITAQSEEGGFKATCDITVRVKK